MDIENNSTYQTEKERMRTPLREKAEHRISKVRSGKKNTLMGTDFSARPDTLQLYSFLGGDSDLLPIKAKKQLENKELVTIPFCFSKENYKRNNLKAHTIMDPKKQ